MPLLGAPAFGILPRVPGWSTTVILAALGRQLKHPGHWLGAQWVGFSPWECRAAQSHQARSEEAQEASWGPAKGGHFDRAGVRELQNKAHASSRAGHLPVRVRVRVRDRFRVRVRVRVRPMPPAAPGTCLLGLGLGLGSGLGLGLG